LPDQRSAAQRVDVHLLHRRFPSLAARRFPSLAARRAAASRAQLPATTWAHAMTVALPVGQRISMRDRLMAILVLATSRRQLRLS